MKIQRVFVFVSLFALAGIGCGGGDDKPVDVQESDAGIISDAGISGEDSGTTGEDAHIIENDADVPEDDAGITDAGISDAGIIEEDSGIDVPDAGPVEEEGFINIPAGSFKLTHQTYLYNKGDTVTLKAFKLSKTPVTVEEFEKCVAAGACSERKFDIYDADSSGDERFCNYGRGDNWKKHPMNCVDMYGAEEYCLWIGGGLPSEEQWEYAASHNGTEHLNTTYAFGNTLRHCVNANYQDTISHLYCSDKTEVASMYGTSAVGIYSPDGDSPLGLVDMTGNVEEWTTSLNIGGATPHFTLKGGCYYNDEEEIGIAVRDGLTPGNSASNVGFRCVK